MTINEAIENTQKKKAGGISRVSARYAQSLLLSDEEVITAAAANIFTKRGKFPGVAAITSRRIIAVCGLPGIKRSVSLPLDELENFEETSSFIQYKAVFRTRRESLAITLDPKSGDIFSAYAAGLNGNDMDSVKLKVTGSVKGSTFLQQKKRNQAYKEQAKARKISNDINLQKKAAARFDSAESDN